MTNPSDLADYETIPVEKMKGSKYFIAAKKRGPDAGGYYGSKAAVYDQKDRPTPSLPRLRFLEGKD